MASPPKQITAARVLDLTEYLKFIPNWVLGVRDGALAKSLSRFRVEIDRHAKYALELGVECAQGDVSDVGAKLEMVTALSGLLSDSVGCKTFTKQVPALWSKACSVCLELQPKLLANISEGTITSGHSSSRSAMRI